MKHRLSVSVSEESVLNIFESIRKSKKCKSQIVEDALKFYFENQNG